MSKIVFKNQCLTRSYPFKPLNICEDQDENRKIKKKFRYFFLFNENLTHEN